MPLRFQVVPVDIPSGTGRRTINFESQPFSPTVLRAAVALNGFRLQFDSADHHLKIVEIDADFLFVDQNQNKVVFSVECNLADKNGDDRYSGQANVLVIAEVD